MKGMLVDWTYSNIQWNLKQQAIIRPQMEAISP